MISIVYGLLAGAWIVHSGRAAASRAHSVAELQELELIKGLGFIGITFALFFFALFFLFRKIRQHQEIVARQYWALAQADRPMLVGILASSIAHDISGVVEISVEDDGPGILEMLRTKILQPFFTTKSDGSGLGLISLTACAERHGGETRIDTSSSLGGACVFLRLPTTVLAAE